MSFRLLSVQKHISSRSASGSSSRLSSTSRAHSRPSCAHPISSSSSIQLFKSAPMVSRSLPLSQVKKSSHQKLIFGASQLRFYSTPSPVQSAGEVSTSPKDSFITGALGEEVKAKENLVPESVLENQLSIISGNEGWHRLLDISNYSSIFDPLYYLVQTNLELLQAVSGLPWWGSIIAFSVLARAISLPLTVKQMRTSAIMERVQPELTAMRNKYLYATTKKSDGSRDMSAILKMREEQKEIMKKHGIGMTTMFKYSLPQAAIYLTIFLSMRGIANDATSIIHNSFLTGGDYWFTNLTVADPTFILPLLSVASTAALIAITPMPGRGPKFVLAMAGILSAVSFIFTYSFPAVLHLFWASSTTVSAITTLALRTKTLKKACNIPAKLSEEEVPKVQYYDQPPTRVAAAAANKKTENKKK